MTERGRASAISARARGVDFARRREDAEDNAVGAFGLGGFDVRGHDRELIVVVKEVTAARSHDDVKSNALNRPGLADHAPARRDPAFQ